MFNAETAKQEKYVNRNYINSLTIKLLNYYSDPDKKQRLSAGLCKCCYYVNNTRIGGSAITHNECENCGKDMSFGNTCVDALCQKCAVELKHCKHCRQKLD